MLDNKVSPTVIALGFFDSVHSGHKKVISTARKIADENGLSLTVFTFLGNVKAVLNKTNEKCVYLPKEREKLLKDLGADQVFFAPITKEFLSQDKKTFLDWLNQEYNIKYYVSGADYTFGSFGQGNVQFLTDYAKSFSQEHIVVDTHLFLEQKVSTSLIKKCLQNGDIVKANKLLGRNYSVSGVVEKDRQVGSKLGFPTANVSIDSEKFNLKNGVYLGRVKVQQNYYYAIVNYGARPTFDLDKTLIEAHLMGFNGDIYGQTIEIEFLDYIRDIQKFNSANQLKEQLLKDLEFVKGKKYD